MDGETKTRTEPRKLEARPRRPAEVCWRAREALAQAGARNQPGAPAAAQAARRQRGSAPTQGTDEKTETRPQGNQRKLSLVVTKEHTRAYTHTREAIDTPTNRLTQTQKPHPTAPCPALPRPTDRGGGGGETWAQPRPRDPPSVTPVRTLAAPSGAAGGWAGRGGEAPTHP